MNMQDRFIRIVGFGLIGADKDNGSYRQIIFKDEKTGDKAELHVNKQERPSLWQDVEKLEKGKSIPPYRGYVTKLNNLNVVVFENEDIDDAFARQKKQLNIKQKISYNEAEAMREKSTGFATNLTKDGALEISWKEINEEAHLIKFRSYIGNGKFVWGNWIEIV